MTSLRSEAALFGSLVSVALFAAFGSTLLDVGQPGLQALSFAWLFAVILWSAFAVVRHADALAVLLGEPYGTLVLTLSVIGIEVMMISAVMVTGADNPTLARDTMLAVVMIVLNGLVGVALLAGAVKHHEQQYNLQGARAFLSVILPLSVISLVLPRFTVSTQEPTFSPLQAGFLIVLSLGLFGVFLAIQTLRHPGFFRNAEGDDEAHHHGPPPVSVTHHAALLLVYLAPIVFLSKKLAVPVDYGIHALDLPPALGGFVVAILVLSPEGMAAVRAALANQLQRAVNIYLGSAAATIALTVPAVLAIGFVTGETVVLGLGDSDLVMLLLTLAVSMVTFSGERTNVLQGAVHLVLFAAYVMLIFEG